MADVPVSGRSGERENKVGENKQKKGRRREFKIHRRPVRVLLFGSKKFTASRIPYHWDIHIHIHTNLLSNVFICDLTQIEHRVLCTRCINRLSYDIVPLHS